MRSKLRLSPATGIATLALFVALGGTSYAVTQINGSELKNGSVTGKKLAKHTVTGEQVNVATLPTVPSARSANDATTAANLSGSIIGSRVSSPVADASDATTAANLSGSIIGSQVSSPVADASDATTAANLSGSITGSQVSSAVANADQATTAGNVEGHTFEQINGSLSYTTSNATTKILNDFGGLTLALQCYGSTVGNASIQATSATTDASLGISTVVNDTGAGTTPDFFGANADLAPGTTVSTDPDGDGGAEVTFTYQAPMTGGGREIVSGTFTTFPGTTCDAFGEAEASSS